MDKVNINFIFGALNKKKVFLCLFLEAFLDSIYYIIPFTFALFLTLPFTLEKAIIVASVFIVSKVIRCFVLWLERKVMDNYLYEYSNIQRLEYYKKIVRVTVGQLSKYQTGYLENIIEKISVLVKKILETEYIGIILSFGFFFYTTFQQSKLLFFVSLALSIACVFVSIYILRKANKDVEELYNQEYKYSAIYQDFISNIRTIKALNNNKYFERIIKKEGEDRNKKKREYVKRYSLEELIRNVLIVIPFALAIIKAVYDLSNGIDTLGIITFYIATYLEMGFIFDELSRTIVDWFELRVLRKKCLQLFSELDTRKTIYKFSQIRLDNVVLRHKNSNFDIRVKKMIINKNDKISITGKSGQGKTSIINLILGNISSYKGKVSIDNHDLNDVKLDIGVVSQEIELFNMSIKENLCLGKNISDIELEKFLKELELDELLMFKDGTYTLVGEKGLKLSTGQKRRINILRSYLADKDIYILDEPTSNLDKHTERIVVDFILKYFKDKTLIIVTHNEIINDVCNKFYQIDNHELEFKRME